MFVHQVNSKSTKDMQKQIKKNLALDKVRRANDNTSTHKNKSSKSVKHDIVARLYTDLAQRKKATEN